MVCVCVCVCVYVTTLSGALLHIDFVFQAGGERSCLGVVLVEGKVVKWHLEAFFVHPSSAPQVCLVHCRHYTRFRMHRAWFRARVQQLRRPMVIDSSGR